MLSGGRGNDTILGSLSNDIVDWTLGDGDDLVRLATGSNTLALVGWQDGAAVANGAKVGLWSVALAGETAIFTNSLGGSVTVLDWMLGTNSVVHLTQPLPEAVNGVVTLRTDALLTDASFAGAADITSLNLRGTGAQAVVLAAQAETAFGSSQIKLVAKASASLAVDGHALTHGFHAIGGNGADSFIGGTGNDTFAGGGGADLFDLSQGGRDRITDFVHGADHIRVAAHSMADLHITYRGGNAAIAIDSTHQATMSHIAAGSLTASDFIFS